MYVKWCAHSFSQSRSPLGGGGGAVYGCTPGSCAALAAPDRNAYTLIHPPLPPGHLPLVSAQTRSSAPCAHMRACVRMEIIVRLRQRQPIRKLAPTRTRIRMQTNARTHMCVRLSTGVAECTTPYIDWRRRRHRRVHYQISHTPTERMCVAAAV